MTEYYVSGVTEKHGECEMCTDEEAQFWTLYERGEDGLSQAVADFTDKQSAKAVWRKLDNMEAAALAMRDLWREDQQQVKDLQDRFDFKHNLTEQVVALQQQVNALAAENSYLRDIIHPIANQRTDVECTDRPVWYVCDPRQMMSPNASQLCHMFHGPFWSRERATEFMESTNYRYGKRASVYCASLYHYPEMRRLYDASKSLETPATDAIKRQWMAEGLEEYGNMTVAIGREQKDLDIDYAGRQALLYAAQLRQPEEKDHG